MDIKKNVDSKKDWMCIKLNRTKNQKPKIASESADTSSSDDELIISFLYFPLSCSSLLLSTYLTMILTMLLIYNPNPPYVEFFAKFYEKSENRYFYENYVPHWLQRGIESTHTYFFILNHRRLSAIAWKNSFSRCIGSEDFSSFLRTHKEVKRTLKSLKYLFDLQFPRKFEGNWLWPPKMKNVSVQNLLNSSHRHTLEMAS